MTPIHHRDCIINTYNKLIFTSVMFAKGEVVCTQLIAAALNFSRQRTVLASTLSSAVSYLELLVGLYRCCL